MFCCRKPPTPKASVRRRYCAPALIYSADGMVTVKACRDWAQQLTPVTPAQILGTIDQMSAYLLLARHLARRSS